MTNPLQLAQYSKFTIYLQPYVAQYLRHVSTHQLKAHRNQSPDLPKEAVYFNQRSWIGKLIFEHLEAHPLKPQCMRRRNNALEVWICDKYLPKHDPRVIVVGVSNQAAEIINQHVRRYMEMEMYWFVELRKVNGINEKDSIRNWIDSYNLTEELSYESAKKALYRSKESLESVIISGI